MLTLPSEYAARTADLRGLLLPPVPRAGRAGRGARPGAPAGPASAAGAAQLGRAAGKVTNTARFWKRACWLCCCTAGPLQSELLYSRSFVQPEGVVVQPVPAVRALPGLAFLMDKPTAAADGLMIVSAGQAMIRGIYSLIIATRNALPITKDGRKMKNAIKPLIFQASRLIFNPFYPSKFASQIP